MTAFRNIVSRASMRLMAGGLLVLLGVLVVPSSAFAAVTVSRAELNGTRLRIEGQANPNSTITVDGVAMGTSDGSGAFRIERDPFAAPADCSVDVNDGSASPASATLSGCSVSSPSASAALSALTVTPTEVIGGTPATGTVTLTGPAPAAGLVIALSSDNTVAATVPASVTVPAGATSAIFPVSTNSVTNPQSAIIIGTVGGDFNTERHAIITVMDAFNFANGSISIIPGGNGSGQVTSQPAGINCTITFGNGAGACSAFFPTGTVVRLDARAESGSKFQGWRGLPGCGDPSKITVARDANINCQPGFTLK